MKNRPTRLSALTIVALTGAAALSWLLLGAGSSSRPVSIIFTLVPVSVSLPDDPVATLSLNQPHSCPRGAVLARLDWDGETGRPEILTPDVEFACDPALSFDASRVFFVAGEAGGRGTIMSLDVDGHRSRPVRLDVPHPGDPCPLPRDQICVTTGREDGGVSLGVGDLRSGKTSIFPDTGEIYLAPAVLDDGRILFVRRSPTLSETSLLTIRPDGAGIRVYASGSLPKSDSYLRYLSAACRRLPNGKTVISHRESSTEPYALYEWDPVTGALGECIFRDADHHVLQPIVVTPRTTPKWLTSVVRPDRDWGWVLCLDAYQSEEPSVAGIERGRLSRVRVLSEDDSVLGESPIAADGSFYVQLPADRPLRLETVDVDGQSLARCTWLWVRPNETKGCVGCHESPGLVPENRVPEAVHQSAVAIGVNSPSP